MLFIGAIVDGTQHAECKANFICRALTKRPVNRDHS